MTIEVNELDRLREYSHHYHDGLITAGEFLYKCSLYIYRRSQEVPLDIRQHNLADKLSALLLK